MMALWDAFNDFHMGLTGELVAEKYKITREEQDRYAFESHQKALHAIESPVSFNRKLFRWKSRRKKARQS